MSEQGKTRSAIDTEQYWDDWKPCPSDKDWLTRHVAMIRDGGRWGTSQGEFRVEHSARRLVLTSGIKGQIYWRTAKVAAAIGWTVTNELKEAHA